jgi:hypothetical protein
VVSPVGGTSAAPSMHATATYMLWILPEGSQESCTPGSRSHEGGDDVQLKLALKVASSITQYHSHPLSTRPAGCARLQAVRGWPSEHELACLQGHAALPIELRASRDKGLGRQGTPMAGRKSQSHLSASAGAGQLPGQLTE